MTLMTVTHPLYDAMLPELEKVRACVMGSFAVKAGRYTYLPHPSQIDQTSPEQIIRYNEYLAGAEFDGSPDDLRRSLLGKMRISSVTAELPERLSYLLNNTDGDGLNLGASIEYAGNNVLQMKWHLLVVDFAGAPAAGQTISRAEAAALGARANIKQYTRENVVNWSFARVNGVMQLRWVKLLEMQDDFNPVTGQRQDVERYLTLGLDESGNYYQQISVKKSGAEEAREEPVPVTVGGAPLKWLPVVIVADEELPNNEFPLQLGYLNKSCDAALHAYRVSAVYKESQRNLSPTTYSSGWKAGDADLFKEINNGRTYMATGAGAVNNLPEGVTVDIQSVSASMEDFHWYFERQEKSVAEMSGRGESASAMTATEAQIIAADQNALLETIAENLEQGFKRAISYCAMFEGLWSPADVENRLDDIELSLPRDFASPKLTPQERQQVVNEYAAGLISQDEALRQLYAGGATVADIEQIKMELEEQPPRVTTTAPVAQTTEGSTQ